MGFPTGGLKGGIFFSFDVVFIKLEKWNQGQEVLGLKKRKEKEQRRIIYVFKEYY